VGAPRRIGHTAAPEFRGRRKILKTNGASPPAPRTIALAAAAAKARPGVAAAGAPWQAPGAQAASKAPGPRPGRPDASDGRPEVPPLPPAPFLRHGASPDRPNRMRGSEPPPHTVRRTDYGVSWTTRTDRLDPTHVATLVSNVVVDLGPRGASRAPGSLFGVTPQPLLGFLPFNSALPGYRLHGQDRALQRSTLHPAGFYPGDPEAARWQAALRQRPETTPGLVDAKLLFRSTQDSRNWSQVYLNVPNLFRFRDRTSVNARAIATRHEVQFGVYDQTERFVRPDGRTYDINQSVLTLYGWLQTHLKAGLANLLKADRGVYATAPMQLEGGATLYKSTNTHLPQSVGTAPVDWRIVNGRKTAERGEIDGQFADIRRHHGLTLASESVLPHWDRPTPRDRSAGVYVQVPEGVCWTAQTLANRLHAIGRSMPAYKELRFVTPDRLAVLNPSLHASGPGAGPGRWLHTGVRVAVGGPGLFLPDAPPARATP
jgi:hypothetical protein